MEERIHQLSQELAETSSADIYTLLEKDAGLLVHRKTAVAFDPSKPPTGFDNAP